MIERYTRDVMKRVWSEEEKMKRWLRIEILVCEAYNKMGIVPDEDLKAIKDKAGFTVEEVKKRERITRHDVAAFVDVVQSRLGKEGRFIHLGLTSSDLLDTTLSLQLVEASDILIQDLEELLAAIREKAMEHKYTVMMGRTHGVHAEPITFGLKMAIWYDETRRNLERMKLAREEVRFGKISGAVGTYAHTDPFVEEYVCEKLGLKPARVSSQIIQRDIYAFYMEILALIASSLEKFATEIRHLQRTEVLEAEEPFGKGQKGSSAMPHKKNPILSENVCGLARLIRSYAMPALENVPLWHERDISHSSVERVVMPDATIALDFATNRLTGIIKGLRINKENMEKNIWITRGLFFSQKLMTELIKRGLQRDEAYRIVQGVAMKCWENKTPFEEEVRKNERINGLIKEDELNSIFDLSTFFRHVDHIYRRVFEEDLN